MSSPEKIDRSAGHLMTSIVRWLDSEANIESITATGQKEVDWLRIVPLLFLHLMCLGLFWVGWSWTAIGVCALLYGIRMFAITGVYHGYFSHKAFKTNRFWQFIFGAIGNAPVQRGPLWWAAHHRHHHHAVSARQGFFWWEIDITYYVLVCMSWLRIVRDLRPVPERMIHKNLIIAETSTPA